ncbi:MAG: NAD(P)-binding domain-containing protein, partial [Alphaproteobacteria bacterium]|nr:NAD(P)-binding domain-containing protein [Alphaproteobacteria bacterium]
MKNMKVNNQKANKIGVLGAGAWGTALAAALARKHTPQPINLWAREADVVASINDTHENVPYLPHITLPDNICATTDMNTLHDCQTILMVVPSQYARAVIEQAAAIAPANASFVLCAKGLEQKTLQFMSQVASDYIDETQLAVLSGPSFADELAQGLPAAVTLACNDSARAATLANDIGSAGFRLYLSDDVLGAEIG